MSDRTPPHDLEAEAAVLGAMLLSRDARVTISDEAITAADFYKPAHAALFATMARLVADAVPVDAVTVADRLGRDLAELGGPEALLAIQAGTPSISNVARYARIVMRHAAGRRGLVAAAEATQAIYDLQDPGEVAQRAVTAFDSLGAPSDAPPRGLSLLADLAATDVEVAQPWVCQGLFREQWRVVAVGPEGFGKSVSATQMAMCIAAGVHPFSFERIPPVATLMLILENRKDTVTHHHDLVERALGKWATGPRLAWSLHRPEGINLRSARHRAELVEVLGRVRPALVVISPVYKAFKVERGENYEQATGEVQRILDELIARYRFALFIEHHAPKGNGGVRDLDPSGSALWLRWPEFGFKLKPDGGPKSFTRLTLDRYRGDRVPADWPQEIVKGRDWPWEGVWENGHF